MNKVINDLSGEPFFTSEVDGELCLMSGYDKPRFVLPASGISGYLGYETWTEDEYKATLNSTTAGTLDSGKYYSVRLVPLTQYIIHQAGFVTGTPNTAADAQTGSTGYIFDLVQHPELISFQTGISTAYTSTTVTDTSKTWAVDQWAGYTLTNRETGLVATISSNTSDTLTFDTDIFTAVLERFSILAPKTTGYAVYAAETNTSDLAGAVWLLQGFIDYGVTTFELSLFANGQVMVEDEYFGPENFKICVEGKGRLFAGGGIYETRGKAATTPAVPLQDSIPVTIQDSTLTDVYVLDSIFSTDYQVYGNTSGADQTYFSEGMVGAFITFEGDSTSYQITAVDSINQRLTISGTYEGNVTTVDTSFQIVSTYDLWYSDVNNPHVFRTGNFVEIPDRIEGLVEWGGSILCVTRSGLYRVPIDNLGQTPTLLPEKIDFNSPYSVVKTPKGVLFYDGEGFSITDGNSIQSITKYKASDYLAGMNRDLLHNIRGVYNPLKRRVEYYFAYGTEITNNYGLDITIDSLNCYGTSRVDCNAVWLDKSSDTAPLDIFHGTSGRHTTAGAGDIWRHDADLSTDGNLNNNAHYMTVTAVDTGTRTVSVQSLSGTTDAIDGWTFLHISTLNPTYQQLIIDTITSTGTGPQTYDLVLGADWDINNIAVGDFFIAGGVPITFGPVWTDFASPVYQHHVRGIQIDSNGFEGLIFVDHYLDSKETNPVETVTKYVGRDDTHVFIPFKGGSGKSYAFRLRGYATTPAQINSISRVFDTEV